MEIDRAARHGTSADPLTHFPAAELDVRVAAREEPPLAALMLPVTTFLLIEEE